MKLAVLFMAALWPGMLLAEGGSPLSGTDTPRELIAGAEHASYTEGFRLRATITREGEDPGRSLRVLIAGQKDERQQKLLIRALAPEAWRDQTVLVEAGGIPASRTVRYLPGDGSAPRAIDPHAPLFDSALVPWEFLGEWRRWPRHARVREEALLGYQCVVIDSRGGDGPVTRVRSWIAPQLRVALRVEFYRAGGTPVRTIRVDKVFRRADGSGAARTMTITDAGNSVSRLDVYSGEEGVALAPDTFSAQAGVRAPEPQGSK